MTAAKETVWASRVGVSVHPPFPIPRQDGTASEYNAGRAGGAENVGEADVLEHMGTMQT
jgi:hypothetical protein